MLQDLKNGTGYAMKRIQKDIRFLLDNRLIPYARMDENKTCLMLTREAGEQYDAAVRSRIERSSRKPDRRPEIRRRRELPETDGTAVPEGRSRDHGQPMDRWDKMVRRRRMAVVRTQQRRSALRR